MDVQEQETTDAFRRQASVGPISMQLLTEPLRALYRARVAWLVLLVFGNVFAGGVIASFEDMIAANVALVFFLPLLIGSGGNAGSQAGCLMVRALALGDVRMADYVKLLGRELVVALMLGASMAAAVSIIGLVRAGPYITMVVAMSMMMIVTIGSVIGMSLPLVLSRLGYDPATASTPLITTIIDAVGVILYLGIAFHLFGLGNG
jgi:magnesium transporter